MSYVELHARSAFSFLEGASLPEDLIGRSAELEMPVMAMLDRNNLSGAVRFHKAADKAGLRAIMAAEITAPEGFRYALLAESQKGYQNLCRLISKIKLRMGHGDEANAVAHPDDLAEHAEGLVCLTGGDEGPLAHALHSEPRMSMSKPIRDDAALHQIDQLVGIFGKNNVFVEIQRHFDRTEEYRNQAAIEIARKLKLPLLATNGVTYAMEKDRDLADALTCVRHKTTIQEAGRLLARNSERHIKHAAEMEKLFADVPEAVANTCHLASRLDFTLKNLGYKFPEYPVPPGETKNSYLRKLVEAGALERYGPHHKKAWRQIRKELRVIEKIDLAGYFLIVWDIVHFAREKGLLVQGRGSAANSAVCYALKITAVNSVRMNMLFERFLSEERGEWPDIDLDFASGDEREDAIQHVYQRYGKLGAAMTANVITYRGRSAVRDIGKVLGFETEMLERLSKVVPYWGFKDKRDTAQRQFEQARVDLRQPLVQKFLSLYERVQDLPRHLGQHSGGMVICQGQLDSIVPLQPATMPNRFVIQWDKEDCADMGIVKVDLLGLGMMAVIKESIGLIREHYGKEVDLAKLPRDEKVYGALQKADTIGMFQVESRAQMSFLPSMKPKRFYDIVVQVAIIRPGPIVGKMLHPYLRRRQGLEAVSYPHSTLQKVLKRTLGVPLFQEQLLRMAMLVAGFTGGQAEELRRAMGFKRSEKRMKDIEGRLREGMTQKGITREIQDSIVLSIGSFAAFGFPESHAASFALLAYASAYLKCRYLAAFTAAMLNNQPMGFYHAATLVKDAQRHGLHFRSVDVMQSQWNCTLEKGQGRRAEDKWIVRLGFNYLKGLRRETAARVVAERSCEPFTSIRDLVRRVPGIRKEEIDSLAEAGAFNWIEQDPMHRREALWDGELAVRSVGELFEAGEQSDDASPLSAMTPLERLAADYRIL
jgi:error-prone DNA polymerase